MTLGFDDYLRHVRANVARFELVMGPVDPTAAVPTCPDWSAGDLRDHMGGVLAFWRAQLGPDGSPEEPFFPVDLGDQAGLSTAALGDDVITILEAAGPDTACWNWSGHDPTTGWVARRIAQETVIHRVDSELTAGAAVTPIDAALAGDGVDELLDVFVDAEPGTDTASATVLHLVATDTGQRWNVAITDEGVVRSSAVAQARLTGTASEILQGLWHRPSAAEWTGDPAAQTRWRALASFE